MAADIRHQESVHASEVMIKHLWSVVIHVTPLFYLLEVAVAAVGSNGELSEVPFKLVHIISLVKDTEEDC